MTVLTNWYTMDNKVGVNLNRVITSATITANPTQPEYPGIPHNLGDRVQGNAGSEWMLVMASATVTANNVVAIGGAFGAENITINHVTATAVGFVYGIAHFQTLAGASAGAASGGVANAGDFFWALIKANGRAKVRLNASMSSGNGLLYIGASSTGTFLTAGSSGMNGIVAIAVTNTNCAEVQMYGYLVPAQRILVSV